MAGKKILSPPVNRRFLFVPHISGKGKNTMNCLSLARSLSIPLSSGLVIRRRVYLHFTFQSSKAKRKQFFRLSASIEKETKEKIHQQRQKQEKKKWNRQNKSPRKVKFYTCIWLRVCKRVFSVFYIIIYLWHGQINKQMYLLTYLPNSDNIFIPYIPTYVHIYTIIVYPYSHPFIHSNMPRFCCKYQNDFLSL